MIIEATVHESMVLQANVASHPGMISVVLGMLSIRVSKSLADCRESAGKASLEYIQKQNAHAFFDQKLLEVGAALASLQNCSEKPPLSQGHAYILDQIAVIQLPDLVRELFDVAGYEPTVKIHPSLRADGNFITTKNRYESTGKRSGISFSL